VAIERQRHTARVPLAGAADDLAEECFVAAVDGEELADGDV
jgi:hypothetical protein